MLIKGMHCDYHAMSDNYTRVDDAVSDNGVIIDDNHSPVDDNKLKLNEAFNADNLDKIANRIKKKQHQRNSGKFASIIAFFVKIAQIAFIMLIDLFSDTKRSVYQCYQWLLIRFYVRRVRDKLLTSNRFDDLVSASIETLDITEYIRCYLRTERVISIYTLRDWISFIPRSLLTLHKKPTILTIYSRFICMNDKNEYVFDIKKVMIDLLNNIELISEKPIENLKYCIFPPHGFGSLDNSDDSNYCYAIKPDKQD